MTGVSIEQVMRESSFLRRPLEDPVLQELRQAILIEDVFGVVLSDEQLSGDDLNDLTLLQALTPERVLNS